MSKRAPRIPVVVRRMVRRIVAEFAPEKVFLFGSRARGGGAPAGDVDLLVVLTVKGSPRDMRIRIGVALAEFAVPVDIVVTSAERLRARQGIPGTIERSAVREGRVVYARPA